MCEHIKEELNNQYEAIDEYIMSTKCECGKYCNYVCMTCFLGFCETCKDKHNHPITVTRDHGYCSKCKKILSIESVSEFHKKIPAFLPKNTQGIGEYLKTNLPKKMIICCGAGISTSSGIPDFRSRGPYLNRILEKYGLDSPETISDIDYFDEHPEPFFERSMALMPGLGKFFPTPTHYFIRFLIEKGIVLKYFTQNIDGLEKQAGISMNDMVMCHGHFYTGHCRKCNKEYDQSYYLEDVREGKVPYWECGGVVKPDIVFFGEPLPNKFFKSVDDFDECDFLLVMGTSLSVYPFANLVTLAHDPIPRAFLNLTDVDQFEKKRDVKVLQKTDDAVFEIADYWGVGDEFRKFLDEKRAQEKPIQPK